MVGLQRALIIFIYECCKTAGSRTTGSLTLEHIGSCLQTSSGSVKTTLQRLESKGLIIRRSFKNGRAGWSKYELPENPYRELLQIETGNKLTTKWQQTDNKLGTQPTTEPATSPSSSSRYLNISNKSTTQPWVETINVDSLQGVGITRSVLIRCRELYPTITPEGLEDLVSRFGMFIKEPKNKIQNARGFFINLAKQLSEGITPLDHIETPNDRLMREFAEKAREKKERQAKFEKEALEFEFETWLEKIPPSEQLEFVPESQFSKAGSVPHRAALKGYFSEKIWPEKKTQILENKVPATQASAFQDNEKN